MVSIGLVLLSLCVGCGGVVPGPSPDACAVDDDGGLPADAGVGGGGDALTSVEACRLLEWASDAASASAGLPPCHLTCPWRGISGPGVDPQFCVTRAVYACVDAVHATNLCAGQEEALSGCDSTACVLE
jgi:hypothetical protein